jgi:hypothetical protein
VRVLLVGVLGVFPRVVRGVVGMGALMKVGDGIFTEEKEEEEWGGKR